MVVYDDTSNEPVRVFDHGVTYKDPETFGEYQLSYRSGDIVSPRIEATEPLASELGDFVAAVREGRPRGNFVEIAANVVAVAECAERSLRSGGVPIEVEPVVLSTVGSS
jgi:hypothetical protein